VLVERITKIAAAAVAVLAIAACVAAIVFCRHWPFTENRVAKSLQETFPATVTFQRFRPTYFPHPGCVAEGIVFHRLGMPAQTPAIVTIQHMKIEGHYLDILFRPGYLAKIVAENFLVHVPALGTKVESTGWKATSSNIRVGEMVLDGSVLEVARADSDPLRFNIHELKLKSLRQNKPLTYEIALHNPLPPGEIRSHGQFGPWNSNDPGKTPVRGEYTFKDADLGVFKGIAGTLSSDDKFQGILKHIEANGSIDIPNFEVTHTRHTVHLKTQFHAFVDGTNGDVQLERINAALWRTTIIGRGEIANRPGEQGKTAALIFTVSDGRIQDVLWLLVRSPKPPFSGMVNFRAHVILPPGNRPFLQRVRLTGDFGIAGGQFTKPSTQETVNDFSQRASGEKPEDKKSEDNKDEDDTAISKLAGHVEVRDATANLSNLAFVVPGASATMHGTYQLETHKIDLHGMLKSEAELSKMSSGFKSVLLRPFNGLFKKKHAGAVVPVHLVGTYEDPQPGVDIVPKNPPHEASAAKK